MSKSDSKGFLNKIKGIFGSKKNDDDSIDEYEDKYFAEDDDLEEDDQLGDDWDDVAEVLEWMSFFVGGAIVHWQLVTGSAEEMKHDHFGNIAGVGTEYYVSLMKQLREYSVVIGKARAQA